MKPLLLTFVLGSFAAASARADDEPPLDQSSPQEVAKEFVKAMGEYDWERGLACMTPESRQEATVLALLPASVVSSMDPANETLFFNLLKKHKLELEKSGEQIRAIQDPKKLSVIFGDFMTLVSKHSTDDPEKQKLILDRIAAGTFSNFQIDGDKATARFQPKYREKAGKRRFVRIVGKWYLKIYEPKPKEAESAESPAESVERRRGVAGGKVSKRPDVHRCDLRSLVLRLSPANSVGRAAVLGHLIVSIRGIDQSTTFPQRRDLGDVVSGSEQTFGVFRA